MKPCKRGESLVVLADKFANTISDLVKEIKALNARVEELENTNTQEVSSISESVEKLQVVVDELSG